MNALTKNSAMIRTALVLAALAGGAGQSFAQNEYLIGREVMTKDWDVKFKVGTEVVFNSEVAKVYEVQKVNGNWLWVVGEGRKGWVKRGDVAPKDQAIDYFNRMVRSDPSARNYQARALAWEVAFPRFMYQPV